MIKFFRAATSLMSDRYFLMIFAFVWPIVNVIAYFVVKYFVFAAS